jgi:cell division GTPase FtsZ
MNILLIGIGAAGNKAVLSTIEEGIIDVKDTCIINSTSKDFPKDYYGNTICLSKVDTGCGKERPVALTYAKAAISRGDFDIITNTEEFVKVYDSVVIATSVEGGTGSGATPIIAKFFSKVHKKNVHIFAFTGFQDDVRGLANTVEFFKEIEDTFTTHTISNAEFMPQAGNNKIKAEELANKEMAKRISVLTGQDFIEGRQNIDDTDILKLSNTTGYMTIEKKYFDKSLETREDFEKIIKNMIYNSASISVDEPKAKRVGVILNIAPASEDAIDSTFESLKKRYGNPYEFFEQIQWDGKREYIAFIASGMKMPFDKIKEVYDKYVEQAKAINSDTDSFYADMQDLELLEEDNKFNMIKPVEAGISVSDFLNNN